MTTSPLAVAMRLRALNREMTGAAALISRASPKHRDAIKMTMLAMVVTKWAERWEAMARKTKREAR